MKLSTLSIQYYYFVVPEKYLLNSNNKFITQHYLDQVHPKTRPKYIKTGIKKWWSRSTLPIPYYYVAVPEKHSFNSNKKFITQHYLDQAHLKARPKYIQTWIFLSNYTYQVLVPILHWVTKVIMHTQYTQYTYTHNIHMQLYTHACRHTHPDTHTWLLKCNFSANNWDLSTKSSGFTVERFINN